MLGGRLLLLERPPQAVEAARFADGRDPMRQPQLVDVVGARHGAVLSMERRADVGMSID